MKIKPLCLLCLVLCPLLFAGCSNPAQPAPTPEPTAEAVPTPNIAPTAAPAPTQASVEAPEKPFTLDYAGGWELVNQRDDFTSYITYAPYIGTASFWNRAYDEPLYQADLAYVEQNGINNWKNCKIISAEAMSFGEYQGAKYVLTTQSEPNNTIANYFIKFSDADGVYCQISVPSKEIEHAMAHWEPALQTIRPAE